MTAGWLPTGLRSSGGDGSGAGSMRASSNFVWRRLLRPAAAARPILPHPVGNELALLRSPSSSHAPMTEGGEAVRARCLLWVPIQHLGDADSAKCVHNEIQALWLTVRNIDPNMDDTVWHPSVRSHVAFCGFPYSTSGTRIPQSVSTMKSKRSGLRYVTSTRIWMILFVTIQSGAGIGGANRARLAVAAGFDYT